MTTVQAPLDSFQRVVVPLDGSAAAERAVPVATAIASASGGSLTLMTVASHITQLDRAQRVVHDAAARSGMGEVALEVLVGIPLVTVLLDAIGRSATIVMSTHARSAFAELVLGSVTDEVLRRSPVPVVLVGPHVERPTEPFQELVACVSDVESMHRLVGPAASAAIDLQLHPWVFQVLDGPHVTVETQLVHHAAERLRGLGVAADWDVGHGGDVARSIVDFSRSRASPLVAVSAHGRKPAQRFRESSVSVAVAREARCPVLVLGPSWSPTSADVHQLGGDKTPTSAISRAGEHRPVDSAH